MSFWHSQTKGVGRRLLLKALAGWALMAACPQAAQAYFIRKLRVRTVERRNFIVIAGQGAIRWHGRKQEEAYRLIIDGLVEEPLILDYPGILALTAHRQISDFHCVEGWSVADLHWTGVTLYTLLAKVRIRPEASHVIFHSFGQTRPLEGGVDHYTESLPLKRLLDPTQEILLAYALDNKPLGVAHGGPLRLVTPFDLAYKAVKFVNRLEISHEPRPGWWTVANPIYPVDAPVPAHRLRPKRGQGVRP